MNYKSILGIDRQRERGRHTKYLSMRDKSEQSSLLSITFLWVGSELSVLVNVLLNELSLRVPCHYSVPWLGNLKYVLLLLLLEGGTHWPTLRNIFKFYPIYCLNWARQAEWENGREEECEQRAQWPRAVTASAAASTVAAAAVLPPFLLLLRFILRYLVFGLNDFGQRVRKKENKERNVRQREREMERKRERDIEPTKM